MPQLISNYKPNLSASDALYEKVGTDLLNKFTFRSYFFGLFRYAKRTKPPINNLPARKYTLPYSKATFEAIVRKACDLLSIQPVGKAITFKNKGKTYYAWLKEKQLSDDTTSLKLQLILQKKKKLGEGGFGKVTSGIKLNSGAKLAIKEMKVAKKQKPLPVSPVQPAKEESEKTTAPHSEMVVMTEKKNTPVLEDKITVSEISQNMQQLQIEMEEAQEEILQRLLEENVNSSRSSSEKEKREKLIRQVFEKPIPLMRSKGYLEITEGNETKQMLLAPRAGTSLASYMRNEHESSIVPYISQDRYRLSVYILVALTLLDACGWGHGDIKELNFLIDHKNDVCLSDLDNIFRLPVGDEPPPKSRIGAHTSTYLDIDNCRRLENATTGEEYATWYKQRDRIAGARTIFFLITSKTPKYEAARGDYKERRTAKKQDLKIKTMTKDMRNCLLSLMNGEEVDLVEACLLFAKASNTRGVM